MFATAFNGLIARLRDGSEGIALVTGSGKVTWGQLGRRVAGLRLALDGLREPGPVLVRGHKQADVVAAMIAAVCAGRGFVFAEANFPAARVGQIIATCGCAGLIDVAGDGFAVPLPVIDAARVADAPCRLAPLGPADEAMLFYVTFTSGSTGSPKGFRSRAPISRPSSPGWSRMSRGRWPGRMRR